MDVCLFCVECVALDSVALADPQSLWGDRDWSRVIGLFIPCYGDLIYPTGIATLQLLERFGLAVSLCMVPKEPLNLFFRVAESG